jgi:hypothetical protein
MRPTIPRTRPAAAALLALVALLAACTAGDPRDESAPAPATASPRASAPVVTSAPSTAPTSTATATASTASSGTIHVTLIVATANTVTVDVTDASATLTKATSGTPDDGASVEAFKLFVTNLTPTSLRLTWLGGPCDSGNTLSIDATRRQFLLVQPECAGDAIATDRILHLEFSTAIDAATIEAFLQDGVDTPA